MWCKSFLLRKFHLTAKQENIRRNPRLERDWIAIGRRLEPPQLEQLSVSLAFPFFFPLFLEKVCSKKVPRLALLGPRLDRDWPAIGSVADEVILNNPHILKHLETLFPGLHLPI